MNSQWKIVLLAWFAVCLTACGDSDEKKEKKAVQAPAPAAKAAPGDALTPTFKKDDTYKTVRQRMIRAGWEAYRKADAEACDSAKCKEYPELEDCVEAGKGWCKFNWRSGDRIATIGTVSDGNGGDTFDTISVQFVDKDGKMPDPGASRAINAYKSNNVAADSPDAAARTLAGRLDPTDAARCSAVFVAYSNAMTDKGNAAEASQGMQYTQATDFVTQVAIDAHGATSSPRVFQGMVDGTAQEARSWSGGELAGNFASCFNRYREVFELLDRGGKIQK
jgi:hypothetical protein